MNHPNTNPDPEPAPGILARALAVLAVPAAVASFLYVSCGVGFYRAPWGYTIAWLTLIASLAYGLPMLDVTIDTVTGAYCHIRRAVRGVRRALADMRRRPCNPARRVRVVRSEAKEVR